MSWDRILGPPHRSRNRAWFVTVFTGSAMLLAAVFAVTRFDEPTLWAPLLLISQHPFWHSIRSLRVHQRRNRSIEVEPGDRTRRDG